VPSGFTAVTIVTYRSQDSAVRLRAGRSGFQIPAQTQDSSLLQKVQTECKTLSASYSTDNWVLSRAKEAAAWNSLSTSI